MSARVAPVPTKAAGAAVEKHKPEEHRQAEDVPFIDLADPLGDLADAWLALKLPVPIAALPSARRCQIVGCRAIPFVQIKTAWGTRNLCLCHFQAVKSRARYALRTHGKAAVLRE